MIRARARRRARGAAVARRRRRAARRGLVPRDLRPQPGGKRAELAAQRGAARAFRHVLREACRPRGVELAIMLRLDQQPHLVAGAGLHRTCSAATPSSAWRARQSRDITVPIGTPVMRAISL